MKGRCLGAVFDLDGTLLDTIDDLADSLNAALGRLGFPSQSIETCKRFIGYGNDYLVTHMLPREARQPATVAECVAIMQTEYESRMLAKTVPYPGIEEMLATLSSKEIALAVLSNKAHSQTVHLVERLLSRWRFVAVRGLLPGTPLKPDPTVALEIAGLMQIAPKSIAFVGDTEADMGTATAAGMYPVGVLWGFRTARELSGSGAETLIAAPGEILSLV